MAEFGLPCATIHKVDERASLADIERLTRISARVMGLYFGVAAESVK